MRKRKSKKRRSPETTSKVAQPAKKKKKFKRVIADPLDRHYFLQVGNLIVPFDTPKEIYRTIQRCSNVEITATLADTTGTLGDKPKHGSRTGSQDKFLKFVAAKEKANRMSPTQLLQHLTPKGRFSWGKKAKASKKTASGRSNPVGPVGLKPDAQKPRMW